VNGSRPQTDTGDDDRSDGITRRNVLLGLGGSGFAGGGVVSGRLEIADASPNAVSRAVDDSFDDPAAVEETVDDLMVDRIGEETPGAIVAVVSSDDTVLTKGYGTTAIDSQTPVRADETLFRIGSVAKTVTFTAVMQGVERGILDLDEDVNTYLAGSPVEVPDTYEDPVTLRHLGTHTAGFGTHLNPGFVDDRDDLTSIEEALVENRPERRRPPGDAVAYSNYGTLLAGHVVAEAYGSSFEEYVQSEVFQPLGMDHSTFVQPVPDDRPGELATPHTVDGGELTVADPVYTDWWPAGSMSTTATDMATFMRAHLGDGTANGTQLLEPETARTMHGEQFGRHPAVNGWAYGFWEDGRPGDDTLTHTGGSIHFLSYLVLALEHDVGLFVSYNARGGDTEVAALQTVITDLVEEYDLGFDVSTADHTTGSAAQQRAERVAGEYGWTWEPESATGELTIRLLQATIESIGGGELTFDMAGVDQQRFVETDPYVYHERDGHDVLAFDVEDGDVVRGYRSSDTQFSWEPVPFQERQLVAGGTAGIALAGFLLSMVGWSGLGAWRWWHRRSDDGSPATDTPPGTDDESVEPKPGDRE